MRSHAAPAFPAPQALDTRMSGSRTGSITLWNDATGKGLITEDAPQVGVHVCREGFEPSIQVLARITAELRVCSRFVTKRKKVPTQISSVL